MGPWGGAPRAPGEDSPFPMAQARSEGGRFFIWGGLRPESQEGASHMKSLGQWGQQAMGGRQSRPLRILTIWYSRALPIFNLTFLEIHVFVRATNIYYTT